MKEFLKFLAIWELIFLSAVSYKKYMIGKRPNEASQSSLEFGPVLIVGKLMTA